MLAVLLINSMIARRRKARKVVNEVKTDMKTLESEYCRTCLGTEGLVLLFSGKDSARKRSKDLLLITGVEIKINDGLSQKICSKCIASLEVALKFRRTSRKAHKSLVASAACVKKKPVEEIYPVEPVLPISLQPKIEEYNGDADDFGCDLFGDGEFQNEQDCKEEDVKPKKVKQKPSTPQVKKQRMDIPNASSYKCTWCSKEFRMKATFKAHLRFHTNYCVCEACGKRCRNNNQLQEHKRARHGLGKIHKCAYCEYSSATKEALTIHERRHTGERPYICDHCGATFHRRSNLVQHIAIHLPEKNFQCRICSKWEKSHKRLQVHIHKRHRAKRYRYICPVCDDNFARPENVRTHLSRGHGVPRGEQGVIQKFEVDPATSKQNTLETKDPCLPKLPIS